MTISCITFDLDDTLWECGSVIAAAEQAFYEWLAAHYPRITARLEPVALVNHRRAFFKVRPELSHNMTELRKKWLARLAKEFDYPEDLVQPGFRLFWEQRNAVTLFEDTSAVLEPLRTRYAVGAITNGNADVNYIGIGHFFDFVVSSADAGASKPSPVIFEHALERAGVMASNAVHVGDDPVTDMRGANEVGMRTIWFNPDGAVWPSGPRPNAEIGSLTELEDVLEAWQQD